MSSTDVYMRAGENFMAPVVDTRNQSLPTHRRSGSVLMNFPGLHSGYHTKKSPLADFMRSVKTDGRVVTEKKPEGKTYTVRPVNMPENGSINPTSNSGLRLNFTPV